jgi:hypothetical protein
MICDKATDEETNYWRSTMFKSLKRLLTGQAGHEPQPLSVPLPDAAPGEGLMINVNLEHLDESSQKEFRQAVAEKSGLSFFAGHVEHGYSLDHVASAERCPRCHAPTEQRYANFIYATQVAARVLLAPAGYFCTKCPTVIMDEELIRRGVTRGFQYHGVAGLDYEKQKPPDFLKTWNGERTVFILDEDENLVGVTNPGMIDRRGARAQAAPSHLAEKARKKRQMAKQSRKRNRRKR